MAGPGRYVPDATEGIFRVEDLPKAKVGERSRNYRHRTCPECGRSPYRLRRALIPCAPVILTRACKKLRTAQDI